LFICVKEKYKRQHSEYRERYIHHREAAIGNELRDAEEKDSGRNASDAAG
jgi:hypothetical protein